MYLAYGLWLPASVILLSYMAMATGPQESQTLVSRVNSGLKIGEIMISVPPLWGEFPSGF